MLLTHSSDILFSEVMPRILEKLGFAGLGLSGVFEGKGRNSSWTRGGSRETYRPVGFPQDLRKVEQESVGTCVDAMVRGDIKADESANLLDSSERNWPRLGAHPHPRPANSQASRCHDPWSGNLDKTMTGDQ